VNGSQKKAGAARRARVASAALVVLVAGVSGAAQAQRTVGHPPERSPFVDLDRTHEVNLFAGPYLAQRDPAGVAPRGGAAIGVHYAWRAGGPAHLTGELVRIGTSRMVLDPRLSEDERELGVRAWPLYAGEAGVSLSLTGPRTWNNLMPLVRGGVGFVSDFRTRPDTGDFRFGTRFTFALGTAVRWIPGGRDGRFQLRADAHNRLYQIQYPDAYYTAPAGSDPILLRDQARSVWRSNAALTVGLGYLMGR
jgi:hypothetical protein